MEPTGFNSPVVKDVMRAEKLEKIGVTLVTCATIALLGVLMITRADNSKQIVVVLLASAGLVFELMGITFILWGGVDGGVARKVAAAARRRLSRRSGTVHVREAGASTLTFAGGLAAFSSSPALSDDPAKWYRYLTDENAKLRADLKKMRTVVTEERQLAIDHLRGEMIRRLAPFEQEFRIDKGLARKAAGLIAVGAFLATFGSILSAIWI